MKAAKNLIGLIAVLLLAACSGAGRRGDSSELSSFYARAEQFFNSSQFDSSLFYLNRCLDINLKYAPAHYLLGKIYLQKDGIYNRRLSAVALREAIKTDLNNPEYHYALGQTLEAQSFALNALEEYKIAAGLDNSDYRPLIRIAAIYEKLGLRYDDDKYFRSSLAASSKAARISNDPAQYYKEASALYQLGLFDSSALSLSQALAVCDNAALSAQCLLLLGADLAAIGNYDSSDICFKTGISLLDSVGQAEIDDLRFLLTPKEYGDFLRQNKAQRRETARYLWARLDPDPTTAANERRLEHYARFVHAQVTFSLPDRHIVGWKTKRGELYIRYGPPTKQEFSLGEGTNSAPYWIWIYEQFSQPAVFVLEDTFLNGDFDFPFPNKNWTAEDYARNPAFLAEMLGSSEPQIFSYSPGTGPLRYAYQIRQFKGRQGGTDLETFVAIPHTELKFIIDGDEATSAVRWRETLGSIYYNASQTLNKVRSYKIKTSLMADSALEIGDRQKLTGASDSLLFSISLKDTLSGHAGVVNRGIRLRQFHTNRVEISDIVLARRIDQPPGQLDFNREELGIYSNIDNRYFISEPVWLYFELYNLARGDDGKSSYLIQLTLSEKRGGGLWRSLKGALGVGDLKEIVITYSGSSVKTDENRVLRVDLSQLSEGDYKITLEINDLNSGRNATVSEDIVIYR